MFRRYFLRKIDEDFLADEFKKINVTEVGSGIMMQKSPTMLIKVYGLSAAAANILKQEFLSRGGDVAVERDCVSGKTEKTDAIIMATPKIIADVVPHLMLQEFGFTDLAEDLLEIIKKENTKPTSIIAGKYKLDFSDSPLIMGILNVTPDSFSGDGVFYNDEKALTEKIEKMIADGVDIIDIGGESTRPGSADISVDEEKERVLPALKSAARYDIPVSIDTRNSETAQLAVDFGAAVINDISGLRFDPKMAKTVVDSGAAIVLNHIRGVPQNMTEYADYGSFMDELTMELAGSVNNAIESGISLNKMIIDPGFGFAKRAEHNTELLRRINELEYFALPLLVGISRKRFLTEIIGSDDIEERDLATLTADIMLTLGGADILRVHNIKMTKIALKTIVGLKK